MLCKCVSNRFSSCFFQLNAENQSMIYYFAFGYTIFSFGFLFIVCEVVQRGCDALNEFHDEIGQIDWYLYPKDTKKILFMIYAVVQRPIELKCFGQIPCNRETFRKVCES